MVPASSRNLNFVDSATLTVCSLSPGSILALFFMTGSGPFVASTL